MAKRRPVTAGQLFLAPRLTQRLIICRSHFVNPFRAWGIFNSAYPDYEVWVWHALTPAWAAKVTAHEIAHLRQALAGYVFPGDEDGREPFEAAADRFAYDFLARFTPALQRCLRTWA
ncbi:MAG: hypothetical protein IIC56_03395 [Proteobacteria bacterium]|nr:hypothetical protein [Pseudomonadota bacterium]